MSKKTTLVLIYLFSNMASDYFNVLQQLKDLAVYVCKSCIEVLQ